MMILSNKIKDKDTITPLLHEFHCDVCLLSVDLMAG